MCEHSSPGNGIPSAITLANVTKRYGRFEAVTDLQLEVAQGEVLGFLGPNGAGKTTTIRLVTGFLRPTAGAVRLLGCDMERPDEALAVRRRLGFMPDSAGFDPGATGLQILDDLAALQGRPPVDRDRILSALDLSQGDLRRPTRSLSRGTRQKLNIVQGMQHRPDLLVLDEPTEGLDPLAKRALFDLLREAQGRGATIFFSSHVLSEVEALCDRVALIRAGRLVAVDSLVSLRAHMQRRAAVLLAPSASPVDTQRLDDISAADGFSTTDGYRHFHISDLDEFAAFLASAPVADLIVEPASLEDVFLQYYRVQE